MTNVFRCDVDPEGTFGRFLLDFEKRQLPFAAMQAINKTSFETRGEWGEAIPSVFDNPVPLTTKAVLYNKATRDRLYSDVYIRDDASKGTPPDKYLRAQVVGGDRRHKGVERQLSNAGLLRAGMFVVPGQGAQLDRYGNIPLSQLNAIKAQIGAHADPLSNETETSRGRRLRRAAKQGKRGGNYFALSTAHGKLKPGVYERIHTGFGSAVRSVLHFVDRVSYRKRYDIYGLARTIFQRRFADNFKREFARAVASAKVR